MNDRTFNLPIEEWIEWLQQVMQPATLIQVAVLIGTAGIAWLAVYLLRRGVMAGPRRNGIPDAVEKVAQRIGQNEESLLFGRNNYDGVLFPVIWLVLSYAAAHLMHVEVKASLFRIALPVLAALVVIRAVARIVRRLWGTQHWVKVLEHTVSWIIWGCVVLRATGLLPDLVDFLDGIKIKLGAINTSVLSLLLGAFFVVVALVVALWVSSLIEARLLRGATGSTLSLRKIGSNVIRAGLLFIAILLGLEAVNIDLTAFSVFGGALGVGIGLGLQKQAANYVSGFVVLLERSVRIGDVIKVDNFEGRVTDITARFTRVRSITGIEAILPNDMLVNLRVENSSLIDPRVWHWLPVTVSYGTDVELLQRLLVEAAAAQPRVAREPAPAAHLYAFGENGLEFRVAFWVLDPENGMASLRSAINLQIWRSLREHGIQIAYPQRVVHNFTQPYPEEGGGADNGYTAMRREPGQAWAHQVASAAAGAGNAQAAVQPAPSVPSASSSPSVLSAPSAPSAPSSSTAGAQ